MLLRHASAYLADIAAPVLGLYPTSGLLTSSEQEKLLAGGIRDLTMIHLPTRSHEKSGRTTWKALSTSLLSSPPF